MSFSKIQSSSVKFARLTMCNIYLLCQKKLFLPPANEICEVYVFTPVCHSVHGGGGCIQGALHPSGEGELCIQGGIYIHGGLHLECLNAGWGFTSWGSASRGICIQGGLHRGDLHPEGSVSGGGWADPTFGYYGIRSTSGRDASY